MVYQNTESDCQTSQKYQNPGNILGSISDNKMNLSFQSAVSKNVDIYNHRINDALSMSNQNMQQINNQISSLKKCENQSSNQRSKKEISNNFENPPNQNLLPLLNSQSQQKQYKKQVEYSSAATNNSKENFDNNKTSNQQSNIVEYYKNKDIFKKLEENIKLIQEKKNKTLSFNNKKVENKENNKPKIDNENQQLYQRLLQSSSGNKASYDKKYNNINHSCNKNLMNQFNFDNNKQIANYNEYQTNLQDVITNTEQRGAIYIDQVNLESQYSQDSQVLQSPAKDEQFKSLSESTSILEVQTTTNTSTFNTSQKDDNPTTTNTNENQQTQQIYSYDYKQKKIKEANINKQAIPSGNSGLPPILQTIQKQKAISQKTNSAVDFQQNQENFSNQKQMMSSEKIYSVQKHQDNYQNVNIQKCDNQIQKAIKQQQISRKTVRSFSSSMIAGSEPNSYVQRNMTMNSSIGCNSLRQIGSLHIDNNSNSTQCKTQQNYYSLGVQVQPQENNQINKLLQLQITNNLFKETIEKINQENLSLKIQLEEKKQENNTLKLQVAQFQNYPNNPAEDKILNNEFNLQFREMESKNVQLEEQIKQLLIEKKQQAQTIEILKMRSQEALNQQDKQSSYRQFIKNNSRNMPKIRQQLSSKTLFECTQLSKQSYQNTTYLDYSDDESQMCKSLLQFSFLQNSHKKPQMNQMTTYKSEKQITNNNIDFETGCFDKNVDYQNQKNCQNAIQNNLINSNHVKSASESFNRKEDELSQNYEQEKLIKFKQNNEKEFSYRKSQQKKMTLNNNAYQEIRNYEDITTTNSVQSEPSSEFKAQNILVSPQKNDKTSQSELKKFYYTTQKKKSISNNYNTLALNTSSITPQPNYQYNGNLTERTYSQTLRQEEGVKYYQQSAQNSSNQNRDFTPLSENQNQFQKLPTYFQEENDIRNTQTQQNCKQQKCQQIKLSKISSGIFQSSSTVPSTSQIINSGQITSPKSATIPSQSTQNNNNNSKSSQRKNYGFQSAYISYKKGQEDGLIQNQNTRFPNKIQELKAHQHYNLQCKQSPLRQIKQKNDNGNNGLKDQEELNQQKQQQNKNQTQHQSNSSKKIVQLNQFNTRKQNNKENSSSDCKNQLPLKNSISNFVISQLASSHNFDIEENGSINTQENVDSFIIPGFYTSRNIDFSEFYLNKNESSQPNTHHSLQNQNKLNPVGLEEYQSGKIKINQKSGIPEKLQYNGGANFSFQIEEAKNLKKKTQNLQKNSLYSLQKNFINFFYNNNKQNSKVKKVPIERFATQGDINENEEMSYYSSVNSSIFNHQQKEEETSIKLQTEQSCSKNALEEIQGQQSKKSEEEEEDEYDYKKPYSANYLLQKQNSNGVNNNEFMKKQAQHHKTTSLIIKNNKDCDFYNNKLAEENIDYLETLVNECGSFINENNTNINNSSSLYSQENSFLEDVNEEDSYINNNTSQSQGIKQLQNVKAYFTTSKKVKKIIIKNAKNEKQQQLKEDRYAYKQNNKIVRYQKQQSNENISAITDKTDKITQESQNQSIDSSSYVYNYTTKNKNSDKINKNLSKLYPSSNKEKMSATNLTQNMEEIKFTYQYPDTVNQENIKYSKTPAYQQINKQQKQGYGKLNFKNGKSMYEGYFKDGVYDGYGKLFNSQETDGKNEPLTQNIDDMIHQKKLQFPCFQASNSQSSSGLNWKWYEGLFKNGLFHGNGKIVFGQAELQGQFVQGKVEGICNLIWGHNQENHIRGRWSNGKFIEEINC